MKICIKNYNIYLFLLKYIYFVYIYIIKTSSKLEQNGSAVGLVAYSDATTIVLESFTRSILETASNVLLQSVGPGRRLNIVKGCATRAVGAAVDCLSNRYILKSVIVVVS